MAKKNGRALNRVTNQWAETLSEVSDLCIPFSRDIQETSTVKIVRKNWNQIVQTWLHRNKNAHSEMISIYNYRNCNKNHDFLNDSETVWSEIQKCIQKYLVPLFDCKSSGGF